MYKMLDCAAPGSVSSLSVCVLYAARCTLRVRCLESRRQRHLSTTCDPSFRGPALHLRTLKWNCRWWKIKQQSIDRCGKELYSPYLHDQQASSCRSHPHIHQETETQFWGSADTCASNSGPCKFAGLTGFFFVLDAPASCRPTRTQGQNEWSEHLEQALRLSHDTTTNLCSVLFNVIEDGDCKPLWIEQSQYVPLRCIENKRMNTYCPAVLEEGIRLQRTESVPRRKVHPSSFQTMRSWILLQESRALCNTYDTAVYCAWINGDK